MALVVVVGVLALLVALGSAFTVLARLERKASLQRLWSAQALLLARSGLEDALARTEAGADPDDPAQRYRGEDLDADGSLGPGEGPHEAFRPGSLDTDACPLRHALRPSFPARSPGRVDGRLRGRSGGLSQGSYALEVLPAERLHVNGGETSTAGEHPGTYDGPLKRILGNLAEELGAPLVRADGEALVSARPAGGWRSLEQIRDLALGGSAGKLAALASYLALDAWEDPKVIRPTALPALEGRRPKSWAELRKGRSDDPPGSSNAFVGGRSASVPPLEPRAPVSLAWARGRRPVLVALIRDLKGLHLDERFAKPEITPDPLEASMGPLDDLVGIVSAVVLDLDEARRVADRLSGYGGDLSTWEGFEAFCDTLTSDLATGLVGRTEDEVQAKRDLLKANFNPNSALNKFGPNASRWKRVDKADLLVRSTEFSLLRGRGQAVSSLGRALSPDGRLLAERELSASWSSQVLRLTTQKDFLGGRPLAACFTPSRAPGVVRTWGHVLPGLPGRGLGLQAYPEPATAEPADWDGNLQLATIETPDDLHDPPLAPFYGVGAAVRDLKMLARFDAGLDLSIADALLPPWSNPDAARNQTDVEQVSAGELALSVLDPAKPNTLFPDGCYSERRRAPAYLDRGNAHGLHGVLSFWVKPNYDGRRHIHPSLNRRQYSFVKWTNCGGPNPQLFFLGHVVTFDMGAHGPPLDTVLCEFHNGHAGPAGLLRDQNTEHRFYCTPPDAELLPAHRWALISLYYNFEAPAGDDTAELTVNGGVVGQSWKDNYRHPVNDPTLASDITLDAPQGWGRPVGPHRIVLGRRPGPDKDPLLGDELPVYVGSGADATFDEFAIYDFGTFQGSMFTFAPARFQEGRYYRGASYSGLSDLSSGPLPDDLAGSYFTPALELPPGARIRRLHWTWHRPSGLPDDYAELELVRQPLAPPAYLWDEVRSRSSTGPGWTPLRQDWEARGEVDAPFRVHVVFRRGTPLGVSTPVLDSPVFDDLSVVWTPPGGPRVTGWR